MKGRKIKIDLKLKDGTEIESITENEIPKIFFLKSCWKITIKGNKYIFYAIVTKIDSTEFKVLGKGRIYRRVWTKSLLENENDIPSSTIFSGEPGYNYWENYIFEEVPHELVENRRISYISYFDNPSLFKTVRDWLD